MVLSLTGSLLCLVGCRCWESPQELNRRLETHERRLKANIHDAAALDGLLRELRGGCDGLARTNAAVALGNVYSDPATSVPSEVIDSLAAVVDRDRDASRDAALTLKGLGPRARRASPALIRAVESQGDSDTAWFSADALGAMKAVDAVEPLRQALLRKGSDGKMARICSHAGRALGAIGSAARTSIPTLLAVAEGADPYLQAELATAVIRIEGTNVKAMDVLRRLMANPEKTVRIAVITELQQSGTEAAPAVSILEPGLTDPDSEIRHAVRYALSVIRQKPLERD